MIWCQEVGHSTGPTGFFALFLLSLGWFRETCVGRFFLLCKGVCLCSRREWGKVPAGVRRQISVCHWTWSLLSMVEGPCLSSSLQPAFMLRVSHPHSQGFPSTCRHKNVVIFLFDFSVTWPEPMNTGFIWYYFLIWYNGDLNIFQSIKHCWCVKKRGRNFESLNTFWFPSMLHRATLSVCFCGFDSYMNRSSQI